MSPCFSPTHNCPLIYRLPLILLYSSAFIFFLLFAGDAGWRSPRSPWPSSEYQVLPHSCLPFTDGEQLKREKCFYGKNVSTDRQRSLGWDNLSKCVFVHGSVYVCDCVRMWGKQGGVWCWGGGGVTFFRFTCLKMMAFPLSLLASACAALVGWLWWKCWLAVVLG